MAKNHEVVRTGKLDEQTNYESGETGKCVTKLSENYGEHSEESRCFWSSRLVNRVSSAKNLSSEGPKIFSQSSWSNNNTQGIIVRPKTDPLLYPWPLMLPQNDGVALIKPTATHGMKALTHVWRIFDSASAKTDTRYQDSNQEMKNDKLAYARHGGRRLPTPCGTLVPIIRSIQLGVSMRGYFTDCNIMSELFEFTRKNINSKNRKTLQL